MKSMVIIAIAFVLILTPTEIYAQDTQDIFDKASKQATIETMEKFGVVGEIIQTSEFDGAYKAKVLVKDGYDEEEEITTYFEIVNGYVKAHNLGVEGQLYRYDDEIIRAPLLENIFSCYDCIDGPVIRRGDCFGQLQFDTEKHNFGSLKCSGDALLTFEAEWILPLGESIEDNSLQNNGGCLIATATFGSELAPQVQQLRELRDNSLLQTESGKLFMIGFNSFYYSFSPTIADWERENPAFKEFVKVTLTPMISSLSILNYVDMDSEESVLGYGISLIILNLGMYFIVPTMLINKIKKNSKLGTRKK
jgi:hypothetical protein